MRKEKIIDSLGYEIEVKIIERDNELYYPAGIWADKHIAYSKLTEENGRLVVKDLEDEGSYAQIREHGKLIMYRV